MSITGQEIGKAFAWFAIERLTGLHSILKFTDVETLTPDEQRLVKYYWRGPVSRYVILVGGGYGAFFFEGSAAEAEEMRVHKARWEGAIARLRPAAPDETLDNVSQCWNHPLFNNRASYADCACGSCE